MTKTIVFTIGIWWSLIIIITTTVTTTATATWYLLLLPATATTTSTTQIVHELHDRQKRQTNKKVTVFQLWSIDPEWLTEW